MTVAARIRKLEQRHAARRSRPSVAALLDLDPDAPVEEWPSWEAFLARIRGDVTPELAPAGVEAPAPTREA